MFIQATLIDGKRITFPVECITHFYEADRYNKGTILRVITKGLNFYPIDHRGVITYDEYETIDLQDNYDTFTFKFEGLRNKDANTKEHKETK